MDWRRFSAAKPRASVKVCGVNVFPGPFFGGIQSPESDLHQAAFQVCGALNAHEARGSRASAPIFPRRADTTQREGGVTPAKTLDKKPPGRAKPRWGQRWIPEKQQRRGGRDYPHSPADGHRLSGPIDGKGGQYGWGREKIFGGK